MGSRERYFIHALVLKCQSHRVRHCFHLRGNLYYNNTKKKIVLEEGIFGYYMCTNKNNCKQI